MDKWYSKEVSHERILQKQASLEYLQISKGYRINCYGSMLLGYLSPRVVPVVITNMRDDLPWTYLCVYGDCFISLLHGALSAESLKMCSWNY